MAGGLIPQDDDSLYLLLEEEDADGSPLALEVTPITFGTKTLYKVVKGTDSGGGPTTFPFGVVMEWGDGYTAGTVLTSQTSRGRVIAPGAGITLQRINLDAKVAVTCEIDILLNGVSIFGAGSTKPNLAAGTTYVDTTFTGTVDLTWADGDLLVGQILSLTGDPLQLALTLAWE